MNEHDAEPIPGLPGMPPEGETVLWQGAPDARALGRRGFHLRGLAMYFAAICVYDVGSALAGDWADVNLRLLAAPPVLGAVALGLVALYALLVARTTHYTVTSRRVAIRFGIALPMTVNIPFRQIEGAGLRQAADGTGDVTLSLAPGVKLAYLVMWPHVRPWRLKRPEPMLRALPDAAVMARVLARALAASAGMPVRATIEAAEPALASGTRPVAA